MDDTLAAGIDEGGLLQTELTAIRAQLEWLKKRLFGGGQGEKLHRAQLLLQIEAPEKLVAPAAALRIAAHDRAPAQKSDPRDRARSGANRARTSRKIGEEETSHAAVFAHMFIGSLRSWVFGARP